MKKMISRRNFLKVCAVAGSAVALSACGGSKKAAAPDPSNTDQTSFDIVGGQSALSPGYNDNEVLKKLADNVGVKLNYETMSDSLSEQVNIRIAGDQLPDAFMGVGFSNYDIANYGADGTFLDLTPYINAEIMPNRSIAMKKTNQVAMAKKYCIMVKHEILRIFPNKEKSIFCQ